MTKEGFGNFIAERRKMLGMTQKDLAAAVHVTDKAVSKWERGLSYPDVTLLEPLADALHLRVEELMACQITEKEQVPMAEETRNLLELSSDSLRMERKHKRVLIAVLIVLVAAVLAGFVFWRSSQTVSEIRNDAIVMKETVGNKNYLYVQEYGHLLRLECGEDIDFAAVTADDSVYELTCKWNRSTYQGTVTQCRATGGVVLGSLMDVEFEVLTEPMFGYDRVYYTWENYVPNLYGHETGIPYLCDFRCWLWDRETDETTELLLVEDCAAVIVKDMDEDGMMEIVVRTRWPEKPYAIYDGEDGVITETWPESIDSQIAERLAHTIA